MWTFYHQTALKTKARSGLRVSVRVSVRVWRVRILNLSVCVCLVVKSIQHISGCPRQQTHLYHRVWLLYHTRHVSFNDPWHREDTSLEVSHGDILTHLIKENNLKLVQEPRAWRKRPRCLDSPTSKNNLKKSHSNEMFENEDKVWSSGMCLPLLAKICTATGKQPMTPFLHFQMI